MNKIIIASLALACTDAHSRNVDAKDLISSSKLRGQGQAWKLDAAQVNSTLYSESLCPDCVHFETGVWIKAYTTPGIGYETKVGE